MIRNFKITFFILLLAFSFSCTDTEEQLAVDNTYVIEFGTACGWCGGTTKLSVKKGKIEYTRNIPCGNDKGTTTITNNFDYESWEKLIAGFDTNHFATLEYNVCNVCVDGCDEMITVTRNGAEHQIRYNPGENIESIAFLQERLRKLLREYSGED